MNFANIMTIPRTGSKLDPKNERGIFRVPVLRYILMTRNIKLLITIFLILKWVPEREKDVVIMFGY